MKFRLTISQWSVVVVMGIMTLITSNLNWGKDNWKGIIEADGKGYYAYLPAIFIYKDLNYDFFNQIDKKTYYDANLYYDYRLTFNGKVINKYYCGTAIAEFPFFLLAHGWTYLFGYQMDGYSKFYLIFITISALFYLFIGLIYLQLSLHEFNINEWQKSFTLIVAVFGTNLFYYAVGEPSMSHIYSFGFISMFIYFSIRTFSSFQRKYIFILCTLLGLIVLIRPVNGLIILIWPFFSGNLNNLKNVLYSIIRDRVSILFGILIFTGIVFIQCIIYNISTGSFFVYSYQKEGFNFLSPHMIDILFSFKKGLFLYTPVLLISLTGGYFLWKNSPFQFYSWFAFFIILTYFLSSWWMWYYGGSFSSRVYVEYISLFMILFGLSIKELKSGFPRNSYLIISIMLVIICQIQTYQYRYYQIHWAEMNREKYFDVFLRIDKLVK